MLIRYLSLNMWIFFDIGSTLVDETVAYNVYAKKAN